jgi:hypothetical protein
MPSKLERLTGPGQPLAAEPPNEAEFEGLKHSGMTRLADCRLKRLSLEGRFDLAYDVRGLFGDLVRRGCDPDLHRF